MNLIFISFNSPGKIIALTHYEKKQDDKTVILIVRTPHVKADEVDLEVYRHIVKFYAKPYYLSLTFKQPLAEVNICMCMRVYDHICMCVCV